MPLADKIIELRKKQGWSQIDLADRLDVSRQSVSKWEMAQAVPELDKIIKMSELFAVTTDYLLKDGAPAEADAVPPALAVPAPEAPGSTPMPPSEEPPAPGPGPEKEAPPAKKSRKKWPWVLAACLALALVCGVLAGKSAARQRQALSQATQVPLVDPTPTPAPMPAEQAMTADPTPAPVAVGEVAVPQADASATDDMVMEVPVTEMTAVSDPDAPELAMMESVYEEGAVMSGSVDPAMLAAIAAEYAPFGITCDGDYGQWYLDGEPIRVFTDILTSNGESLTGGHFQGTMRNFAGEGDVDVRTVRDFNHCDNHGVGKLLYMESCPAHGDAVWTEHHAELRHTEDHHE